MKTEYQITSYGANLYFNNEYIRLRKTDDSGRVVTRKKINTVMGVPHPGIIIGIDQYGRKWIAHHHYKNIYPTIDTLSAYADGQEVFYDNEQVVYYSNDEMVNRALFYWYNGPQYSVLFDNCQQFVSVIATNQKHSESLDEVGNWSQVLGGLALLFGVLTENKTLATIGTIALVGGSVTKAINNTNTQPTLPANFKSLR